MKAGDRIASKGFLECPNEIVTPGTEGTVKKVSLDGGFMDVQFVGIPGLWNVAMREVRPCP